MQTALMDQRANFLALILLDALEDENKDDVYNILSRNDVDASFVPCDRGIAPLHYSCGMDNEKLAAEITARFLQNGANPNVRSEENVTPLHIAAMYGRAEIVSMLLGYGAEVDVVDDERKTPVHYAIEECHFEVVQLMRDHIFRVKCAKKDSQLIEKPKTSSDTTSKFIGRTKASGNSFNENDETDLKDNLCIAAVRKDDASAGKNTPNRPYYNYDTSSPYYINITHRRNKPQPKLPESNETKEMEMEQLYESGNVSTEPRTQSVNLFTLTKENLEELTGTMSGISAANKSHLSIIELWREKVQRSRARKSILKQYDNVDEMIDHVMENDHLNFTNTEVRENSHISRKSDDAMSSDSSVVVGGASMSKNQKGSTLPNISLGQIIQQIASAQMTNSNPVPNMSTFENDEDSSYQTVPELRANNASLPPDGKSISFIRSPKTNEYFLQMTEAYVHTDDENGLVFYETKLLSNQGVNAADTKRAATDKDKTVQEITEKATACTDSHNDTQVSNFTIPLEYETDALRAELTTFGEPPGPITKSTKRMYIKRLIKYKRKAPLENVNLKQGLNGTKFSVELHRTIRSLELFQRISEYMSYEKQSATFFTSQKRRKQMREGHLKQSFIYMLIDPRVSCNLPGESMFLDKFDIWKRFLQSIFYVGKGKTSRPYSHLYTAMKTYSRIHSASLNNQKTADNNMNEQKISLKKQAVNVDIFRSPPKASSDSQKLDRILHIWGNGNGVVCLHVFHNIVPIDAYTREAAIIDALSLQHLTNIKRGNYYGPAQTWTMKEKKYFGIALLYKAMQIYLAEGESQLSPSDLI